jgi:hypothetical protein
MMQDPEQFHEAYVQFAGDLIPCPLLSHAKSLFFPLDMVAGAYWGISIDL